MYVYIYTHNYAYVNEFKWNYPIMGWAQWFSYNTIGYEVKKKVLRMVCSLVFEYLTQFTYLERETSIE